MWTQKGQEPVIWDLSRIHQYWSGESTFSGLSFPSVRPMEVSDLHYPGHQFALGHISDLPGTRCLRRPFGQWRRSISTAVPVLRMVRHCKLSCARRYASHKGFRWCCCRRQLIVSISNGAEHSYKHGFSAWILLSYATPAMKLRRRAASRNGPRENPPTTIITLLSRSLLLLHLWNASQLDTPGAVSIPEALWVRLVVVHCRS